MLKKIDFVNEDSYNFAFDTVDAIAKGTPKSLPCSHLERQGGAPHI